MTLFTIDIVTKQLYTSKETMEVNQLSPHVKNNLEKKHSRYEQSLSEEFQL